MHRSRRYAIVAGIAFGLALAGCGSDGDETAEEATGAAGGDLPRGSEHVELDPADFTTKIDNPYWPMSPGSRWVYREDGAQVEVTVTNRTKEIANGVTARVVHDVVSEDGEPKEITDDWYAQDSAGNIWYLGEDTTEYENGKPVTTAGSFEAGVDGAEAGIIMPADPEPGQRYRQEYYEGEAEDYGEVLSLDGKAKVPFGSFDGMLRTKDVNPLSDPPEVENKFYAKGIGPVLVTEGGEPTEELLRFQR